MTTIAPENTKATAAATVLGTVSRSTDAVRQTGRRAYLYHLDLIRATTFSLVIFVHCLTNTTDEFTSLGVNTTALLLHFTRNTFFALTGFVLMYQNFDKADFSTIAFWRKRIKLVIFPYLAWSAIYWVITDMWANGRLGQIPGSLGEFAGKLSWGLSGFQMYFLFVMLQVYLVFPLVLWLVRATRGHHLQVLVASFVVQLAIASTITHWNPPGVVAQYWWHNYATFVPYQFFILYGAVAAVHREAIGDWLRGKGWMLFGALVTTGTLAVGVYLGGVWFAGKPVHDNNSAFYPTLLPFLVVAIACLYSVALNWGERWREFTPRFARAVSFASNRSFGVFLAHVLVLWFILRPKSGDQPWILVTLGQPWGTLVVYLATIAGSLLLVEILRRLPGSLWLTGRPRLALRS
ncbi:acyltransferase [Gordonia sp. NPDC003424]